MDLEKIEITVKDSVSTTSGRDIPSNLLIVVEANKQAVSVDNNYHVFPDCYYNLECKNAGKSTEFIEKLHNYINEGEGVILQNEFELIISINGEEDVDTLEKRKSLIINALSSKLEKNISSFE